MLHLAIGETKLGVSEIEDVIKIIRKLLRGGALIDNQDRHLRSPMHLCIASMNTKAAECLIAHNADPNILDEDKYTPLDRLAAHRSPDERLAILLVNNGAKLGPGNWPPLIQGPNFKRQASVRATLRRAGRVGV
jgi:ankyrin repeat protein